MEPALLAPHPIALIGCAVSAAIGVGPRLVFQPVSYNPQAAAVGAGVKIPLALAANAPATVRRAMRRPAPVIRASVIDAGPDAPQPKQVEAADVSAELANLTPLDGARDDPVAQRPDEQPAPVGPAAADASPDIGR